MRMYLASRYGRRPELQGYRSQLIEWGHEITARWLIEDHSMDDSGDGQPSSPDACRTFAMQDIEDLFNAEIVVCFTEHPESNFGRGGRHVELGLALSTVSGFGLIRRGPSRVVVVGPRENVFTFIDQIIYMETPEEFMTFAQGLHLVEKHFYRKAL